MKTLFRNARILKMDGSPILLGDLVVEDKYIKYIGQNSDEFNPFDCIIECNGNLIMPGFKNAHGHGAMTFLRSKAENQKLQDWLFKTVIPREELLRLEDVYNLSKVAYLEYLTSGITASFEHYYHSLEISRAAEDMGFRVCLLGCFHVDRNSVQEIMRNHYNFNNKEESLTTYMLGCHAEYTASEEELSGAFESVHTLHMPFYTHISETQTEVGDCINRRGVGPAEYLINRGLFDYGGGGYHCIYLSDKEIELFKKYDLTVVTCPGSNSKLASGIAPLIKYINAGLRIAIGTDGPASNNSLDMFKEMQLIYSLQRLQNNDATLLQPYDILKMATVNGARAMGLTKCDTLEVGKYADIIEINLNRPNMQPINDVVANLVYSGSQDNVLLTMINGKILYRDHQFFVGESIEEIYKKAQQSTERIENDFLNKIK